jgi:serine/threonine-protein kinase RsbT
MTFAEKQVKKILDWRIRIRLPRGRWSKIMSMLAEKRKPIFEQLAGILQGHLSSLMSRSILRLAYQRTGVIENTIDSENLGQNTLEEIRRGIQYYIPDPIQARKCIERIEHFLGTRQDAKELEPVTIELSSDEQVVLARKSALKLASAIGFGPTIQVKIATTVSELCRNAFRYATGGRCAIYPLQLPRSGLEIKVTDSGPGITNLEDIMAGNYSSKTGLGLGLRGCKRLMDDFKITSDPQKGTEVIVRKYLE